jgi:hypothetical protein
LLPIFFWWLLNLHVVMYGFPVKAITPTSFLDRNLKTYCNTLQMPWHRQRETASQSQYTIDRNNFNQLDEWSWWMIMTYSVILHNILYYTETFFLDILCEFMWYIIVLYYIILMRVNETYPSIPHCAGFQKCLSGSSVSSHGDGCFIWGRDVDSPWKGNKKLEQIWQKLATHIKHE